MSLDGARKRGAQAALGGEAHDLGAVERHYRAGTLSNREIARQHGRSEAWVRKLAKANGWARDLAGAVRHRVRESLVREGVRANQCELGGVPSDAAIIDEAAAMGVAVVRSHRYDINALREAAAALLSELSQTLPPPKITERSRVIADLSQAMARLVPLERKAFSLDDEKPDPMTGLSDGDLAEMIHALKSQLVISPPTRSGANEAGKQEPAQAI